MDFVENQDFINPWTQHSHNSASPSPTKVVSLFVKVYVRRWPDHQPGPSVCLPWGGPANHSTWSVVVSSPPRLWASQSSHPKHHFLTYSVLSISRLHRVDSPVVPKALCQVQTCQASGPGDSRRESLTSIVCCIVSPLKFTSTWSLRMWPDLEIGVLQI